MTDQELLLAISDIVETKIKAEVEPLKIDIRGIDKRLTNLEREIKALRAEFKAEKNFN